MSKAKPLKELVVETTGHDEVDRKREMERRLRKLAERGHGRDDGFGCCLTCGRALPCPDAEYLEGRFDD